MAKETGLYGAAVPQYRSRDSDPGRGLRTWTSFIWGLLGSLLAAAVSVGVIYGIFSTRIEYLEQQQTHTISVLQDVNSRVHSLEIRESATITTLQQLQRSVDNLTEEIRQLNSRATISASRPLSGR